MVNELDSLRATRSITKADLAREIGKHPASVRRLFTAPAIPELRTVVAMADALDADVVIVPRLPLGERTKRAAAPPEIDEPRRGARSPRCVRHRARQTRDGSILARDFSHFVLD